MKLLTLSIAAYNVENFLEETLISLCDNRYVNDIEILIIDDGSKDGTGAIGKKYQELYPDTVIYVKKENGGHGSTINKGIELASGKYFRIIDGDDYVDRDAFYSFVKKLKETKVDMVISNYSLVDNYKNKYDNNCRYFKVLDVSKEIFFDKKIDARVFGLSSISVLTKLLKENNIRITEKCYYVDLEFLVWTIYLSESFIYYNEKVYMYRCINTTQNSVSKKNMLKNVSMQEKVSLKLCDLFTTFCNNSAFSSCYRKQEIILERIQMAIGATMRTYLLCNNSKESAAKIMDFDKQVLTKNSYIYNYIKKNKFIKITRVCNYAFIPVLRILYNGYLALKH